MYRIIFTWTLDFWTYGGASEESKNLAITFSLTFYKFNSPESENGHFHFRPFGLMANPGLKIFALDLSIFLAIQHMSNITGRDSPGKSPALTPDVAPTQT